MKTLKLKRFLDLLFKANVILINDGGEFRFVTFNHNVTPEELKEQVDKKYHLALYEHLELLFQMKENAMFYLKTLEQELTKSLYEFKDRQGIISHNRLIVVDEQKNTIDYESLPDSIKYKISIFMTVQMNSLKDFISSTSLGAHSFLNQYRWTGSKIDLVELGNALYESGVIEPVNGKPTKKDFIEYLFCISGIEINAPHKVINKAMNRENPSHFIDRLRGVLKSCSDRMLNNN